MAPSIEPVAQVRTVRWVLIPLVVALAAAAWLTSGDGEYTVANVTLWATALAGWSSAWWPASPHTEPRDMRAIVRRNLTWLVPLGLIVALGAFFRFYDLGDVPGNPTSDHAEKLLDVNDVLEGRRPIFFERNTGREPAQFYFTVALMKVFGLSLSHETLKIGTALVGVLSIPTVFLLARAVAGTTVGLVAAALVAVGKWPITLDRFGLRFTYATLATALALWLLVGYLRRRDRRYALVAGVAIGLGLHGYIPFRVVPLLVPLFFALALLRRPRAVRTIVGDGILVYATAFVACLPLVHFTVQHFDLVFERANSRLETGLGWGGRLQTFVDNNWNALLAFNWRGDVTWVNAVTFDPFFDRVTAGVLLAGIVVLAYRVMLRRDLVAAALLLSVPVLLLSSTLSLAFPVENPAANRMTPAIPLAFTVAALPFGVALGAATGGSRRLSAPGAAVIIATTGAFAAASIDNYSTYFDRYAKQYRTSVLNTREVAETMLSMRSRGVDVDDMFVVAYPYWLDGRSVGFELGDPDWYLEHNVSPGAPLPRSRDGERSLYVLHREDDERRKQLEARFPRGEYRVVRSDVEGMDFALFLTPDIRSSS